MTRDACDEEKRKVEVKSLARLEGVIDVKRAVSSALQEETQSGFKVYKV